MDAGEFLGEADFAESVRRMCRAALPADIASKVERGVPPTQQDYVRWQQILADKRMLTGHWPIEFGGQGWNEKKMFLFHLEVGQLGAPWLLPFGVNYVGPVIYTFGSPAQKAKYLPGIADASTFWCQGFSEPNAGSDLAALRTMAVRNGDRYIVNGSKIWTTMAHWADMIFCLVRTNTAVKPQKGISFLLIDLKSPGIEIRPIKTIDGHHHVNEVFFRDVEVPVENLVGDEDAGWNYAKFLLNNERYLAADIGKLGNYLTRIERVAEAHGGMHPDIRGRLRTLRIDVQALKWTALRMLASEGDGRAAAGASMLKLRGAALVQSASELALDCMGAQALASGVDALAKANPALDYAGLPFEYLYNRAPTIWGGSNEIQRNIIAKQVLGLS